MPLARIVHTVDSQHQALQDKLVQEWDNPQEGTAEPVIIEDRQGRNGPIHVYVIWSEWASLDQIERSEIIMNACEQVRGIDFALEVTVAMGLIAQEAERMRIAYTPLASVA